MCLSLIREQRFCHTEKAPCVVLVCVNGPSHITRMRQHTAERFLKKRVVLRVLRDSRVRGPFFYSGVCALGKSLARSCQKRLAKREWRV